MVYPPIMCRKYNVTMKRRNRWWHILVRKSLPCMDNFNEGTRFIKCKIYQIDAEKLIELIKILYYYISDLIW